jgi:hypothetical protein
LSSYDSYRLKTSTSFVSFAESSRAPKAFDGGEREASLRAVPHISLSCTDGGCPPVSASPPLPSTEAFVACGLGPSLNALGIKIVDALPGALIAVSYLSATYAVRAVESAIKSLNLELENAARILGTGPFRALISYSIVQSK